jgi:hypothetical protein
MTLKRWNIVIGMCAVPIGFVGFLLYGLFTPICAESVDIQNSQMNAQHVAKACELFRKYESFDGRYPQSMGDLIHGDGKPLLDGGDRALCDSWGEPFKYALVPNEEGILEPYVWFERTKDGKTTLFGAKWSIRENEVVTFGSR